MYLTWGGPAKHCAAVADIGDIQPAALQQRQRTGGAALQQPLARARARVHRAFAAHAQRVPLNPPGQGRTTTEQQVYLMASGGSVTQVCARLHTRVLLYCHLQVNSVSPGCASQEASSCSAFCTPLAVWEGVLQRRLFVHEQSSGMPLQEDVLREGKVLHHKQAMHFAPQNYIEQSISKPLQEGIPGNGTRPSPADSTSCGASLCISMMQNHATLACQGPALAFYTCESPPCGQAG